MLVKGAPGEHMEEMAMLMYSNHRQNWVDFGHILLIFLIWCNLT